MNSDLGGPFRGPVLPCGSMIIPLRRTSQDSTNLVREFYLEYSLDMQCAGKKLQRRYCGRRH